MNRLSRLIDALLARRIVRYALVGGIGIPINIVAYALFRHLFGVRLDLLASILSFEVSTTVNFALNQTFTYSEQTHLRGWDWPRRWATAQTASASGLVLTVLVAQGLQHLLGVNPYLAQICGIVITFFYNFVVSRRFVFRAGPATAGQPGS